MGYTYFIKLKKSFLCKGHWVWHNYNNPRDQL